MILASQSPRRRELLSEAGYEFRVVVPPFDEASVQTSDPGALVQALATGKAFAAAGQADAGEAVIGSDTVVVLNGSVLGKPQDEADAAHMLERLSGRTHDVVTGVSIVRDGNEVCAFTSTTHVRFWDLQHKEIEDYVATGEPLDKAGAYGIQGRGRLLVRSIEGDYYTVVGLPIARLHRELRRLGAH